MERLNYNIYILFTLLCFILLIVLVLDNFNINELKINNKTQNDVNIFCSNTSLDANCNKKCTDGTFYGQCSSKRPYICENGELINNCKACGCDVNFYCYNTICSTCKENWVCSEWNECVNKKQNRGCFDSNNCKTIYKKPLIEQDC